MGTWVYVHVAYAYASMCLSVCICLCVACIHVVKCLCNIYVRSFVFKFGCDFSFLTTHLPCMHAGGYGGYPPQGGGGPPSSYSGPGRPPGYGRGGFQDQPYQDRGGYRQGRGREKYNRDRDKPFEDFKEPDPGTHIIMFV